VYHAGYGSYDDELAVFMPVPNIGSNLIYKVVLTSPTTFDCDISHATYTAVSSAATKSVIDQAADILAFAMQISGTVVDLLYVAFHWIHFLFVKNIGLTVALYISGSLAFSARKCRGDPIKLLRQFFKDQKALFEFIIGLWNTFVSILSNLRGIFRI
jgi:hypothetical protein